MSNNKKCIYCVSQPIAIKESSDVEMYIETNSFTGQPYMYDEYSGNVIDINFCPMCGRSLKEDEEDEE